MSEIYAGNVVRIAIDELGYQEKASNKDLDSKTANAGTGNWTKYARDLWEAVPHFFQGPKNGYDWCTILFDWCVYMASGKDSKRAQEALCYTGPYGAGCGPSVAYYKAAGRFWPRLADGEKLFIPKPGDQIFFGTESSVRHTGMVEYVDGGTVHTIEGNSGNMVRRRSYALSNPDILGYGRPKYDGDEPPTEALPFVDVKKGSWYYDAVKWAWENGIVAGTDETHFSPNKACTRAEVLEMIYAYNKSLNR